MYLFGCLYTPPRIQLLSKSRGKQWLILSKSQGKQWLAASPLGVPADLHITLTPSGLAFLTNA